MKKILLIITIFLTFSFITSCTTENKNLDEIYDLKVEVEYARELTESELLELLDQALVVEEDNKYGILTWYNFNYKNETVKFAYDYRGSLSDYQAFYDYSEGNTLYFKSGYAYITYNNHKTKSKISDSYAVFSVEKFKQEFMYKSSDYPTPYMLIELLNDVYGTDDFVLDFAGIDKRDNYILNAKVYGDDSRFVFNDKYELIYISVYDSKGENAYCIYDHSLPTIEYPNLSEYVYSE